MTREVFISTELVEEDQRTDLWREISRPMFEALPHPDDIDLFLSGSVRAVPVGSLMTARSIFNRQRYNKDRRFILSSGLDSYLVQLVTSGELAGDFNGVRASAGPGDILILDLSQPLKNQVTEGSRINIVIPRQPLEKAVNGRNLHGTVLKRHWPVTQLVMTYLTGLHSVGTQLSTFEADAAHEAAVTLMAAALKNDELEAAGSHSVLKIALQQRIVTFIDQNINLPDLSPETIMRRFHVSRSHLYRTFADHGGIAKVLRDKRLDAAFVELTRRDSAALSITEISYRFGFSSSNQFLRGFRARFGITPSQARQERQALHLEKAEGSAHLLNYFATLRERVIK